MQVKSSKEMIQIARKVFALFQRMLCGCRIRHAVWSGYIGTIPYCPDVIESAHSQISIAENIPAIIGRHSKSVYQWIWRDSRSPDDGPRVYCRSILERHSIFGDRANRMLQ